MEIGEKIGRMRDKVDWAMYKLILPAAPERRRMDPSYWARMEAQIYEMSTSVETFDGSLDELNSQSDKKYKYAYDYPLTREYKMEKLDHINQLRNGFFGKKWRKYPEEYSSLRYRAAEAEIDMIVEYQQIDGEDGSKLERGKFVKEIKTPLEGNIPPSV